MRKLSLPLQALILSVAVTLYVGLISFVLNNAEQWFSEPDSTLTGTAFLMMFVLSAAIVGSLVFARPVYMYMEGNKRESVKLLAITVGWLVLFTVLVLITLAQV